MRTGITISILLHVSVVLAAVYGLPELMEPVDMVEQPIIVELVTVAELTVSQKPIPAEETKAPPPAPLLKPIAAPEPEPEPEPEKTPPPPPEPIKVAAPPPPMPPPPEPAKPEPEPEPEVKPVEVVTPKPPEKPPEKLKAKPKVKPNPPEPKKKLAAAKPLKAFRTVPRPRSKPKRRRPQFDTDRIAALLDKDREKKPRQWRKAVASLKSAPSGRSPRRAAPARSVPMTLSEIDAIRYQIQKCWSIPAGARDAENLVVRIKVFLNSDGSLSKPPKIIGGGVTDDPFYRAAAESARRAVLRCAPLKNLPVDKYARWRELTLTFNPSEMLGG